MTGPRVTAISVSYNCAALLRVMLASLRPQEVRGGLEIIVVDNASEDDSAAAAASFADVTVVPLRRNAGFAAANNEGVRRARGEELLFVNPDVEVPAGVVAALSEFLAARPAAVGVGPKVVDRAGRLQRFCARRAPTPLNLMVRVSGLDRRRPFRRWGYRFYPRRFYEGEGGPVEVLSGAFMMVRRGAYAAAGGFDEGYFLYGEDVDLCRRLSREGELWYLPRGPVTHYTGGSRRTPAPRVVVAAHESAERYARRWHGRLVAGLVRLCSRASLAAAYVLFAAAGLFARGARRRRRFYGEALRALARRRG